MCATALSAVPSLFLVLDSVCAMPLAVMTAMVVYQRISTRCSGALFPLHETLQVGNHEILRAQLLNYKAANL